jgi:hypothetical protein
MLSVSSRTLHTRSEGGRKLVKHLCKQNLDNQLVALLVQVGSPEFSSWLSI